MAKSSEPKLSIDGLLRRALIVWNRAVAVVPRLQTASCRALAVVGLVAVSASFVLQRTGPDGGFNGFCVGLLFGLGVGIALVAIAALARERMRKRLDP